MTHEIGPSCFEYLHNNIIPTLNQPNLKRLAKIEKPGVFILWSGEDFGLKNLKFEDSTQNYQIDLSFQAQLTDYIPSIITQPSSALGIQAEVIESFIK